MKNVGIFLGVWLWGMAILSAQAQDNGLVLLDLDEDSPNEVFTGILPNDKEETDAASSVLTLGYNLWEDVKQYDELLPGETIEKDFSEDIKEKHQIFNASMVQKWQNYVRKGVKVYRFYNDVKQKVKDWVFNYELPVVLPDDQYEMGGDEEYIASDEPLVRYNFKKIVAYSEQPKDKLAVEEKIAREKKLMRPSQIIKWYRENIAQGNWKKLAKSLFDESVMERNADDDNKKSEATLRYMMFLRNNSWDKQGNFDGVLQFTIPNNLKMPLGEYQEDEVLRIDFADSENIEYVNTYLTKPQSAVTKENQQILFYVGRADVYFKAKAKDVNKKAVLRVKGVAPLCDGKKCSKKDYHLELQINPVKEVREASRGYYVQLVAFNVPREENAEKHKIYKLGWLKDANGDDYLNVQFSSKNLTEAKVFLLGKEAKYFSAPRLDLKRGRISANFKLLNADKDDIKEVKLWLAERGDDQYITTRKIAEDAIWNVMSDKLNLSILLLAFFGGLSVNLFGGGAPIFWLKLRGLADFGGKNLRKVRTDFGMNAAGMAAVFAIAAISAGYLKYINFNFIWGMQFLEINYLLIITWVSVLFIITADEFFSSDDKNIKQIFIGVWGAIWALSLGGIFWGEAITTAWDTSAFAVIAVLLFTGLGMISPYALMTLFPGAVKYIPADMQWRKITFRIALITALLLIVWQLLLIYSSGGEKVTYWFAGGLVFISACRQLQKKIGFICNRIIAFKHKRERLIKFGKHFIVAAFGAVLIGNLWFSSQNIGAIMQSRSEKDLVWSFDDFLRQVKRGQKILVKVEADWCLPCRYNNLIVFNQTPIKDKLEAYDVRVIAVDIIKYREKLQNFLSKFAFKSLPLYVWFSPQYPEGLVLPQEIKSEDITELIKK